MIVKKISTGYKPRSQQADLHRKVKRFNVLVCHRRFGKSVFVVNEIIDTLLRCPYKNPQAAYVAPYRDQAKRIIWQYFKDFTKAIPGVKYNEAELRIDIQRKDDIIRAYVMGADNPITFEGMYFDIIALDEYGRIDPRLWSTQIRATLSDADRGSSGRAFFLGTPKGQNDFEKKWSAARKRMSEGKPWFAAMYKASETKILSAEEYESMTEDMDEDEIAQEMECSFNAGITGAYYKRQLNAAEAEGRITTVPWDPNMEVFTYWDLGMSDNMVIWFVQKTLGQNRIIDYEEDSGMEIGFYAKILKEKPYVYAEHVLPHDGKVRDLQTGATRVQALEDLGCRPTRALEKSPVYDGISAVRQIFPTCYFDEIKCEKGLKSLRNYVKAWDVHNKTFSSKPHHNWASHAADGFRTFAMGQDRPRRQEKLPETAITDYDMYRQEQPYAEDRYFRRAR